MKLQGLLPTLALVAALAPKAGADDCRVVTRANVVACVLSASQAVRVEREGAAAAAGRRVAAEPWFPSSPTLSVSAAQRNAGAGDAVNYYASLSQEIDLAGQRASRRRAADADVGARGHDVVAASRRVAAAAWVAYFEVLGAREALAVSRRLEATASNVARVTRARADAGVASNLDAEMTEAQALRLAHGRAEAERAERSAGARLATLIGRDASRERLSVEGALEPLASSEAATRFAIPDGGLASAASPESRPEVRALREEQRAHALRAEAFRRARFPTVTVQLFAQNDGLNERVLGAGLALPLPLPQPLGRTFQGEAAESEALSRQAGARARLAAREASGGLAEAVAAFEAARAQAALYTDDRVQRAERTLAEVAREIEAGRLGVRDAVLAQQQLVDVLRGRVEARRALGVASVAFALAAGVPLEGGEP